MSELGIHSIIIYRLRLARRILAASSGGGVVEDETRFGVLVIPAKAGIQAILSAFAKVCGADSRFVRKFSTVALCFQRHSRFVRSILKNSSLLPPQESDSSSIGR
jgi:hypothetical protein